MGKGGAAQRRREDDGSALTRRESARAAPPLHPFPSRCENGVRNAITGNGPSKTSTRARRKGRKKTSSRGGRGAAAAFRLAALRAKHAKHATVEKVSPPSPTTFARYFCAHRELAGVRVQLPRRRAHGLQAQGVRGGAGESWRQSGQADQGQARGQAVGRRRGLGAGCAGDGERLRRRHRLVRPITLGLGCNTQENRTRQHRRQCVASSLYHSASSWGRRPPALLALRPRYKPGGILRGE